MSYNILIKMKKVSPLSSLFIINITSCTRSYIIHIFFLSHENKHLNKRPLRELCARVRSFLMFLHCTCRRHDCSAH